MVLGGKIPSKYVLKGKFQIASNVLIKLRSQNCKYARVTNMTSVATTESSTSMRCEERERLFSVASFDVLMMRWTSGWRS